MGKVDAGMEKTKNYGRSFIKWNKRFNVRRIYISYVTVPEMRKQYDSSCHFDEREM